MAEGQAIEVKIVSKLSMKNAGISPKKVHALPEGKNRLLLARILGMADGIKQVDDPTHGTTHKALVGRFQAIDAETKNVTRSGILYLPKGIHDNVVSEAEKLEEGATIQFAFDVYSVKADNPAGYSYEAVDLIPPREADPLDMLERQVEQRKLSSGQPQQETVKATGKK